MKEIQGKIKFGVVPIPCPCSRERIYFEGTVFVSTETEKALICGNVGDVKHCSIFCKLSEITEEQAAEFVEYYYINGDYKQFMDYIDGGFDYTNPKESLISLLKANDVWIKEWMSEPNRMTTNALSDKNKDRVLKIRQKYYFELPDDLLLIKLT